MVDQVANQTPLRRNRSGANRIILSAAVGRGETLSHRRQVQAVRIYQLPKVLICPRCMKKDTMEETHFGPRAK